MNTYTDMLANYGVTAARPGGRGGTNYVFTTYPIDEGELIEFGAGLGDSANYLWTQFQVQVTAVEKHKKMLEKGKLRQAQNKNIHWLEGDIMTFTAEKKFQTCLVESVLSFSDIRKSLRNIHSLLVPGGKLYLLEPMYLGGLTQNELEAYKNFYGFEEIFTEAEWLKSLKDSGFQVLQTVPSSTIESIQGSDNNFPELMLDEVIEEDSVEVLSKHLDLTDKYLAYFDYAYFICEKTP